MKKNLDELIAAARRELGLRRSVYPKRVAERKMTQDKADHEIQCMADIVEWMEDAAKTRREQLQERKNPELFKWEP